MNATATHPIHEAIRAMKGAGYKVFASKPPLGGLSTEQKGLAGPWCFAVTPSGNVLEIDYRDACGWAVSFLYRPSCENGTGCVAGDRPLDAITPEALADAERAGLVFARKLRATLYRDSDQWRRAHWCELVAL